MASGATYPPYDAERAAPAYASSSGHTDGEKTKRPASSRNPSWDMLGGIKKLEQSYENFDTRNASQSHLIYAEGDMPKNKVRVSFFVSRMARESSFCFDGARSPAREGG